MAAGAAAAAEAAEVEEMHPQNTEEGAVGGPNLGNQVKSHYLLAANRKIEMYKKGNDMSIWILCRWKFTILEK